MRPVVHAPSIPSRFDPLSETRVPAIDLKPANEYGEIKLLTDMNMPITPETIPEYARHVHTECAKLVEPDDFILQVGDPGLIAAAIAGAHIRNGFVKTLRWDRHKRAYDIVRLQYD